MWRRVAGKSQVCFSLFCEPNKRARAVVLKGGAVAPQRAGGTVCRQFWLSYLVGVGVTTGIWWMKVRDAAKKPYNAQNSPP